MKKSDVRRNFPPDYCDAQTLAYRLCIAESTLWAKVKARKFPAPIDTPFGPRWKWSRVEAVIDGDGDTITDPFMVRVQSALDKNQRADAS